MDLVKRSAIHQTFESLSPKSLSSQVEKLKKSGHLRILVHALSLLIKIPIIVYASGLLSLHHTITRYDLAQFD